MRRSSYISMYVSSLYKWTCHPPSLFLNSKPQIQLLLLRRNFIAINIMLELKTFFVKDRYISQSLEILYFYYYSRRN